MDILKYVAYLREISRKIVANSDFNRALSENKSKKDHVYPIDSNGKFTDLKPQETSNNRFRALSDWLDKNVEKGFFIGIGLIEYDRPGRPTRDNGNFIKNRAPLLYAECEIENVDGQFEPKIIWETLCLNNDLLAALLSSYYKGEDEDENLQNIANDQIIEDTRRKIESFIKAINSQYPFNIIGCTNLALECITELRKLDALDSIKIDDSFELGQQVSVNYYNKCYYFTRRIPDQLSTYEALQTLYDEIREKNFENESLKKILSRATGEQRELVYDEEEEKKVTECINKFLPYSLSENQKIAITNAFSRECSYIQGPPGTGKSFTISMIVLCAIFMEKSILVVSQKRPALKVIEDMVNKSLDEWGLLYFDLSSKKSLKEKLNDFKQSAYFQNDNSRRIISNKDISDKSLLELLDSRDKLLSTLEEYLNNQEKCLSKNEKFLTEKKQFESAIGSKLTSKIKFDFSGNINILKKAQAVADCYKFSERSILNTFIGKKLLKSLKQYFPAEVFKIATNKYSNLELFSELANLLDCFQDYASFVNKLPPNPQNLRDEIADKGKKLNVFRSELMKLKYKYNKYFHLNKFGRAEKDSFIDSFKSILHFKNVKTVSDKQSKFAERYGYDKLLKIFPFWAAEVRDIGRLFPMKSELFDLVIVDEASQVNLAEIFPIFYRGKRFVIAGDHHQLGLNSTGVNFTLSNHFDAVSWNDIFNGQPNYNTFAVANNLSVTKSSILDFIRIDGGTSIPSKMLDEHWRSLPGLAAFTNKFYANSLKVMTETGEKFSLPVFAAIKVNGQRNVATGIIANEAQEVINIIKSIVQQKSVYINGTTIGPDNHKVKLPEHVLKSPCTIGVISIMRKHCDYIVELASMLNIDIQENYDIMIGTPEEFQGHERDIMILSPCLDNECRGFGHYKDEKRFNVATSRAKLFTILVYSAIPCGFNSFREYMSHFLGEINPDDFISTNSLINVSEFSPIRWQFNSKNLESEFEFKVYECLENFINSHNSNKLKIFNQVTACGQKRLDFVIYNEENHQCVAVEVDGVHHFAEDQKCYSEDHLERIYILKRAGWNIINTPYNKWYLNGWLCTNDHPAFKSELHRIYKELKDYLGINVTERVVLQ